MPPAELLQALIGPAGAIVLLAVIGFVLWRDHIRADQDDRDQRDRSLALAESAVAAQKESAEANRLMAIAWNERNRLEAARRRKADA